MAALFAAFVQVHVRFRPQRQEDRAVEVPDGSTAGELIVAVGESLDMMVVVRGNTPIAETEPLVDGEQLMLLSAASGG